MNISLYALSYLFVINLALLVFFEKKTKIHAVLLIFAIINYAGVIIDTANTTKRAIYKEIAQDVDQRKIMIKGEKVFHSQVKIVYRDGRLLSVTTIPKTTISLETEINEKTDTP